MSHSIYLRVEVKDSKDEERLKEMLEFANLKNVESFKSAESAFYKEEAENRLDMYEANNDVELVDDNEREKLIDDIANALSEDSQVICDEQLDEVTMYVAKDYNFKDVTEEE